ncbi:MAG: tyrosine-type recombinase/integrase [Nanoarchaeota archaeon]|mgnify:CR=1 FL=1
MLIEQLRKEGERRGLSPRKIKTYADCVNLFLKRNQHQELKRMTKEEIKEYLDRYLSCSNTYNVNLNALKFFFEEVLHKRLTFKVRFSKTPKRLPEFLTKEEVPVLLAAIKNPKHCLMVELMYGTGMRVSELVNVKIKDLDFEHNFGWVRQDKGRKDRPFILPLCLKEKMIFLIKEENLTSEDWLFSTNRNKSYSVSSLREIIKRAKEECKLNKNIHPHTLRHSFATHVIQNGYTATELQPLLGHAQVQTTMMYVHMASPNMLNVRSPLDSLKVKNG